MSDDAKKTALDMIALYQARIERLTVETNRAIEQLQEAIRQARITAGLSPDDSPIHRPELAVLEVLRKKRHEAADWALRKLGGPSDIDAIAEYLAERGYSPESEHSTLINSLTVSMKRHPSQFHFDKRSKTWGLVEWKSGKKGRSDEKDIA